MNIQTICVLGGTGFVGRHLLNRLIADGYRLRVPTRRRERHRDLLVLPGLDLAQADVLDRASLAAQIAGCEAVINLVGILNERGRDGSDFHRVHVELPRRVAAECLETGAQRLLHMSALHANAEKGPSIYLRTKGEGEDLVHAAGARGLQVTSFRPSVIFGPGDSFFNRFAALLKLTPGVLPLACPGARFAPIYVGDLAECFARALKEPATVGQRYDLCGPRIYTLKGLVEYTAQVIRVRRWVVGLGDRWSYLQARVLQHVPGKPLSVDNYLSLQVDSVCDAPFPGVFGVSPQPIEAVVPGYLADHSLRARYMAYRRRARRD
jgi:uncharacterized protein YbjT (DUF2867 family)